ncbi:SRPBCC domain-containing protein [Rubritalea tangerina]|uniref:SRPBCC domain-containing protein n=2 Tax=Rubritalea tangerina TaxID=430798 RepID=A0ABW4ZD49_9BACT
MSHAEKNYEVSVLLDAEVEKCWGAIVGREHAWMEHMRVELEAGGDFVVSSKLPYLSGRHRVVSFKENERLKLQWYVEGWPSEVEVVLEPEKGKTRLTLQMAVDAEGAPESVEALKYPDHYFYFIGQSWRHSLQDLKSQLLGGTKGVRVLRANNDHLVRLEVEIKAPAKKVFEALTQEALVKKWNAGLCMKEGKIEGKVGGVYSYGWYPLGTPEGEIEDGPMKVLELEKDKLLVIDWYGGTEKSRVSWEIEPMGDGRVKVKFKHATLLGHSHGNVWSYRSGWADSLYALKWYLERDECMGDWLKEKQ